MKRFTTGLAAAFMTILAVTPTWADSAKIRIGKQQGLTYLPLLVAQKEKLIEKHARAQGAGDVEVEWIYIASAAALTDGLLSGQVDYVAGASTVLNVLWDKTRKDVKGVVNLSNFDFLLNTSNSAVKTVKDFTESDRIAVSGVKLSVHAIIIQMAAAQAFGDDQWDRLDRLTVSLPHPEGMAALLSGKEITAHITTPPFQTLELADPRVHTVLKTSDILPGGAPVLVFTSSKVRDANPKLTRALIDATAEAVDLIHADPRRAAEIYAELEKTPLTPAQVEAVITEPGNQYSTVPQSVLRLAQFQHRIGTIKAGIENWRDLFFPEAPAGNGS